MHEASNSPAKGATTEVRNTIAERDQFLREVKPDFFSTFFMFPFGFDNRKWQDVFSAIQSNPHWSWHRYTLQSGLEYNEYVYFYPYIWSIIFGEEMPNDGKFGKNSNKNYGVYFFKHEFSSANAMLEVETCHSLNDSESEGKPVRAVKLPLKNIFLHLFDTGVGILVFEVIYRPKTQADRLSLSDYLYFLNCGRRVYLPFIHPDAKAHSGRFLGALEHDDDGRSNAIQKVECPSAVRILVDDEVKIEHKFSHQDLHYYERHDGARNDEKPRFWPVMSKLITGLLDSGDFEYQRYRYWPIIDDRMMVHSFYSISSNYNDDKRVDRVHKYFLDELQAYFSTDAPEKAISGAAEVWYQMIFIDREEPSCQNPIMFKQLLRESTYPRWSNYETFYGFSRFSSVTISSYSRARFVYNHFQSMYYQMAILLLFYRGALLQFSKRSEAISKKIHELETASTKEEILEKVQELHKSFLLFRNKYWFREVTAQDQGIEIFDIWSRKMRNRELLEDAQEEIKELHTYVETVVEKNTSRKINVLTLLGGIFIPLAIVTSFFGMNLSFVATLSTVLENWMTKLMSSRGIQFDYTKEFVSSLLFLIFFALTYRVTRLIYAWFVDQPESLEIPGLWHLVGRVIKKILVPIHSERTR